MINGHYDPAARAAEKQRARERDDADLAAGRISREEMSRKNGFFSGLDLSQARIVPRNHDWNEHG